MALHSLSFDKMNESDVREEFLSPLLDMLGYRVGAEGNVLREHALSLRYPRLYLGRKNRKTDPYLRGRADYILEVKGHARWVLEAKGPNEEIDANSIEQACSYASHPEVRAPLFVLSNGRRFLIFRTSAPPNVGPLLETTFESIQADVGPVERILGVDAIRREYRDLDAGEPIAPGLGSLVKIASGFVRYTQSNLEIRAITELQAAIVGGTIERGANGGLIASIQVRAPISSVQDMIADLGLDQLQYESDSRVLSDNPDRPTNFKYRGTAVFPEGREIFDVVTGTAVRLPMSVSCQIVSQVDVFLVRGKVVGEIRNTADYFTPNSFRLEFSGRIEAAVL